MYRDAGNDEGDHMIPKDEMSGKTMITYRQYYCSSQTKQEGTGKDLLCG